ncbi:zinc finger and BTB domain-containing protein 17-like isoform X4 [Mizuhopecten yessoensis]|nr:zinc finger and BTB domain-containing protein 17-like isoform X4 [Mizuhopecten yessoensis]
MKDSGRGHSVSGGRSVSNVASSGLSEGQHDDRNIGADPLMMHVKEEPMSDYDDEDDASFSEDTSESQGYSGTTDFVRQAPYDTRPFPDEEAVSRGNKMVVALPPPPSLQKRPSLKRKSFHPSAQRTSQTSETDSVGVNEDVNSGDIGASGEGGVDATKVLKNIVKSIPEMAMNLGTSSEIGDDNKPRVENKHIRQRNKSVSHDNAGLGVFHCKAPGCHYQSGRLFNLNRHVTLRHISSKKRLQRPCKEKAPKRIEKSKVRKTKRSTTGEVKERYLDCQYPGCRFRTARMYNLRRHVAFKHAAPPKGEAINMCEKCGEMFVLKQGLEHHRQTVHAGLFRYMCKICEDGFQNLADFQSHMSKHIKVEIYHCDHCDLSFQCSDDLTIHLMTCDQVPKGKKGMYRCQWCMKRFSRKEVLTDHIKVHSSSKTYPCEVDGCGRVFTYQSALNKHIVNKHWALGLTKRRESGQHMYVTVSEEDLDKGLDYVEQPVFMTLSEGGFDKGSATVEQPVFTTLSDTGFNSFTPELS